MRLGETVFLMSQETIYGHSLERLRLAQHYYGLSALWLVSNASMKYLTFSWRFWSDDP